MKPLPLTIALLLSLGSLAQREKPVSLRFTGQFDFSVRGMALNNAGMGVNTGISFFAKKRVNLLTEAHSHWYIGDKQLIIDNDGKALPNGSLHALQAGPQVFLSKTLALSTTYGVAWHRQDEWDYTRDAGYRVALTGYFGDQNNFITQLSWLQVPRPDANIRHWGIGVGYRLL